MYNIFICLVQFFTTVTQDKQTHSEIKVHIINYLSLEKTLYKKNVDSNTSN